MKLRVLIMAAFILPASFAQAQTLQVQTPKESKPVKAAMEFFADTSYLNCQGDNECVIVQNNCRQAVAVAQVKREDFEDATAALSTYTTCPPTTRPLADYIAQCQNSKCVATLKPDADSGN